MGRSRLVALVAALTALPASSSARVMMHHDLTSLALLSDAIVLAERRTSRTLPASAQVGAAVELTEMHVKQVYAGLIADGSTFEVSDSAYALDGEPGAPLAERSRDVVLFLVRSGRTTPRWWIVASGVRVQAGGRIFRFEQHSNPGPYVPVPQGRDPFDVRDGLAPEAAVDLATFEADLRAALVRAEDVKAALAPPPFGPRRREPRWALLPPIQDRVSGPGRALGFYRDEVAHRMVESFLSDNDLQGALEARSRVIGAPPPIRGRAITASTVATFALTAAEPVHRRVEALTALWDTGPATVAVVEQVAPLLNDPSPDIRAAAVTAIAIAGRHLSASVRNAARAQLASAARREIDPLVRIALSAVAREMGLRLSPRGPARTIVARRRGEDLSVAAAWRGKDTLTVELAGVTTTAGACTVADPSTAQIGGTFGVVARIRCPEASAPWSVALTVRSGRAQARETIELAGLPPPAPVAAPAPAPRAAP